MYLEIWQLLILIVVCGVWSEFRYIEGRKKSLKDCTRDVDVMVETSICKAKIKYMTILAGQLMDGLIKSGLLERKGDGIYIGKDDRTFDFHDAIEKATGE